MCVFDEPIRLEAYREFRRLVAPAGASFFEPGDIRGAARWLEQSNPLWLDDCPTSGLGKQSKPFLARTTFRLTLRLQRKTRRCASFEIPLRILSSVSEFRQGFVFFVLDVELLVQACDGEHIIDFGANAAKLQLPLSTLDLLVHGN